jgi:predicted TPR repeat methyltransferase
MAGRELNAYRRRGAVGDTKRLVGALIAEEVEGATLLDIGGGVGIIGHELLAAGASRALDVDASRAYLAVATEEAERRGHADRTEFRYGDFVELAATIDPADIVSLDRVVCCYPDWQSLIGHSTEHARRLYGLVYPVDRWWTRLGASVGNTGLALFRQSFRFYVHPEQQIDAFIRAAGWRLVHTHGGLIWRTAVYRRV